MNPPRVLLALLLVAASGCGIPVEPAQEPSSGNLHWSYAGDEGPSHWADLDPEFLVCREGLRQSPIDLVEALPVSLADPELLFQESDLHILNNGHTVQIQLEEPEQLNLDGTSYQLKQLHFHSPSEHTFDSRELPLELHFVFSSADRLVVLAVLAEEGVIHPVLEQFWDDLPGNPGEEGHLRTRIDPDSLFPADRAQYRYLGSLTTPPCTEGVEWIVFRQPIQISAGQLQRIRGILGENRRPVQPLQSRRLSLDLPDPD